MSSEALDQRASAVRRALQRARVNSGVSWNVFLRLAELAGAQIDITEDGLRKFENGSLPLSEPRIRELEHFLLHTEFGWVLSGSQRSVRKELAELLSLSAYQNDEPVAGEYFCFHFGLSSLAEYIVRYVQIKHTADKELVFTDYIQEGHVGSSVFEHQGRGALMRVRNVLMLIPIQICSFKSFHQIAIQRLGPRPGHCAYMTGMMFGEIGREEYGSSPVLLQKPLTAPATPHMKRSTGVFRWETLQDDFRHHFEYMRNQVIVEGFAPVSVALNRREVKRKTLDEEVNPGDGSQNQELSEGREEKPKVVELKGQGMIGRPKKRRGRRGR